MTSDSGRLRSAGLRPEPEEVSALRAAVAIARNTPGPWSVQGGEIVSPSDPICSMPSLYRATREAKATLAADASLIAAAPDHADIGWAMCVAAGRWEPWGDGRGEFVLNGIRFATRLDQFGVPEVVPALRAQIAKARGDAPNVSGLSHTGVDRG